MVQGERSEQNVWNVHWRGVHEAQGAEPPEDRGFIFILAKKALTYTITRNKVVFWCPICLLLSSYSL